MGIYHIEIDRRSAKVAFVAFDKAKRNPRTVLAHITGLTLCIGQTVLTISRYFLRPLLRIRSSLRVETVRIVIYRGVEYCCRRPPGRCVRIWFTLSIRVYEQPRPRVWHVV